MLLSVLDVILDKDTATMKSFPRYMLNKFFFERYYRLKMFIEQERNFKKSVEEVFTEIYEKNKWGGEKGEYYSGAGTTDVQFVSAYVSVISEQLSHLNFKNTTFVDLGCGDFCVGKQLIPLCSSYIGVDVVKPLIFRNQNKFSSKIVKFVALDIVEDELPDGDVCFIRHVFQHLSNQQIISVLKKLGKYKYTFITEHYPTNNGMIRPNIDKVHSKDIRIYYNSGVYLSELPFGLPTESLDMVLEIPGMGLGTRNDQGVIRTFLYKNQRLSS